MNVDDFPIQRVEIRARRPPSDDVSIIVDGHALSGWTDVRITRSIERVPNDFELGMTDLYPGDADAMQVKPGDPCEVKIGKTLVLTGFIDRVIPSIDGRQHAIKVLGRGKCCDLVDCAAVWPGSQIKGSSVLDIAQKLAKPYDIKVAGEPGSLEIPTFNLNLGETTFEIIERLCRVSRLLAYEQPDGSLLLANTRLDFAASGFAEGVNVERAWAEWSADQRFSVYKAVRLSLDPLTELGDGGNLIANFTDPGVKRFREFIVVSELASGLGLQTASDRAQWEAARRLGRSHQVAITTDSWRDADGALYAPNTLATVDLPSLKVDGKLWTICEVSYRKDASGTHCDVKLMPPDAFQVQPALPPVVLSAELAKLPDAPKR
jgi:prophage tail gpP-like protein